MGVKRWVKNYSHLGEITKSFTEVMHSKDSIKHKDGVRKKKKNYWKDKPAAFRLRENNCMSCYFTFIKLKVIRIHSARIFY